MNKPTYCLCKETVSSVRRVPDESFPRSGVAGCRQRGLLECSNPEVVEEGGEQSNASLVTVGWPLQRVRHPGVGAGRLPSTLESRRWDLCQHRR